MTPDWSYSWSRFEMRHPKDADLASDVDAGRWVVEQLWPWPTSDGHVEVGALVPEGFDSYAAIRHESPDTYELSEGQCRKLVDVLEEFTSTADLCWFCLWTGFGGLDLTGTEASTIRLPQREYLLYRGPLSAVQSFEEYPQWWWPDDRRWFVGGDVDLARSFVVAPLVASTLSSRVPRSTSNASPSGHQWRAQTETSA
jgi:hypothetical protein